MGYTLYHWQEGIPSTLTHSERCFLPPSVLTAHTAMCWVPFLYKGIYYHFYILSVSAKRFQVYVKDSLLFGLQCSTLSQYQEPETKHGKHNQRMLLINYYLLFYGQCFCYSSKHLTQ